MWRRLKWRSRTYELIPAVNKVYTVSASCVSVASQGLCFMCISCVQGLRFMCIRDACRRLPTFAPPEQRGKQTRRAARDTPHTKYRDTTRRLTSDLNGYMEGNPQGRERYHPRLSATTMAREQWGRRTSNRGTLVPEPFVLLSAAWYTTVTSGNLQ